MTRLLADHVAPAVIFCIEPLGGGNSHAATAIKLYASAHLDKWATLRQRRWFLVFDAHQRRALIVLQYAHRAHRNFVASFRLSDRLPISGGTNQLHRNHRHKHGCDNQEGSFQIVLSRDTFYDPLLCGIEGILSIRFSIPLVPVARDIV